MKGYHVSRRFGWDTHGVPIEYEIDKRLGISGRDAVMNLGIENYNAQCREIVMRHATEWRQTIERLGRWIDFDNDYKVWSISILPGGLFFTKRRNSLWMRPSWSHVGGCSSGSLIKATSIEPTRSCLIRPPSARRSASWSRSRTRK